MLSGLLLKNKPPWLAPLAAALLTCAVFLPSLGSGFVNWDDVEILVENLQYRGLGPAQLRWMFTTHLGGPYQPLSWLTYGFDYLLWGMNPFGYHLTNILLHALNAAVFCFLCLELFTLAAGRAVLERTGLYLPACFAALFFSLHPLRVESVAWVTERRDVLSGLFYLLAVLFYIQPRAAAAGAASFWRRHLLPLTAFLLALLSKGMAVSLPAVLIILDVYPLRRLPAAPGQWFSRATRPVWLEKLPYLALAVIFGAVGYFGQLETGTIRTGQGFAARAADIFFSLAFYPWKTLLPFNLVPFFKLPGGLTGWPTLLAGIAVLGTTAALIILRRRWPAALAAWLCYLAALSPVSGLVKMGAQAAADRYSYLPCLGFAALAGAALWRLRSADNKKLQLAGTLAAVLVVAGLGALTVEQQKIWRSSEALWRHTLAINPEVEAAHNNLGLLLAAQGKAEEAAAHYQAALRLNPASATARTNIGVLLAGRGRYAEAAIYYLDAVSLDPGCYKARTNLCGVLPLLGRAAEAIPHCAASLKLKPDAAGLHNNLGIALASLGQLEQAIGEYKAELALNPGYADAYYNLGHEYAALGKPDLALENYAAAVKLNPAMARAHYNTGVILTAQNKPDAAIKHYQAAVQADPAMALAHNNLAITLNQQGRRAEALLHYQAALKINPNYAEVYYNLALDAARHNQNEAANNYLRRAREINPNIWK
ncbi:MAG TPA: tetratricopeptide repeat protein [Elusimicrobiales bacterium]|nr:tetratricopeptide repeat protein [Elusimicrobiales bacterium]